MAEFLENLFGSNTKNLSSSLLRQSTLRKRLDLKTPVEQADYVAFDTELTGLNFKKDSLISIGAVKLKGSRILPAKTFYRLVKPESEMKHKSIVVHEITPGELTEAEESAKIVEEFIEFIGDAILIGHFVHIDVNFVNRALKKAYGIKMRNPTVDTASLHEWLMENNPDFTRHYGGVVTKKDLFLLAKKYAIEVEQSHNALWDAYITAQLFQQFLCFLSKCGIKTIKELLAVGK